MTTPINHHQMIILGQMTSSKFPRPTPILTPLHKPPTRSPQGVQLLFSGQFPCAQALFNKLSPWFYTEFSAHFDDIETQESGI